MEPRNQFKMVKNILLETLNNYKKVTVEPETAEVDIATYISVTGRGSFIEQIFYSRISAFYYVFFPFLIHRILTHGPFDDESRVFAYFTFLQKILPLPEFLLGKKILD